MTRPYYLELDQGSKPVPQLETNDGNSTTPWKGENNAGRITGDVDHGAVDSGKPVKIGGKAVDPASLPADVATGDRVNTLFDLKGRLFVRLDQPLPAGTNNIGNVDVVSNPAYNYLNITTDAQIKAGAGKLRKIIIGKVTVAGDLTIYDSLTESGTIIATLDIEETGGDPKELEFDVSFSTGLYAGFDATLTGNITFVYE